MIDKKALQLLLYAQKFYPKEYANFANALEARHIPWDISNDQFTSLLGGFGAQFSFFLSSKNITVDKPAIERVVPTKEVLAPLVAELEQARDSQEQGKHFESNGTKIEKFINAIKRTREQKTESVKTDTQIIIEDVAPKLIQTAEFFSQQADLPTNTQGFPEIPTGFFTAVAQTPLQKVFSGIVDLLPQRTQQDIIQSAIGKAYKTIQEKTDALGYIIAESETVKRIISQTNAQSFQQPGARLTPNKALYNIFSDIYISVFIGPQLEALRYATYQSWPIQSSWSQISAFALSLSGATTNKVARFALKEAGEKVISSSFGKSIGAWIGGIFGPGIGNVVGYFLGDLVLDKFFSFIGRGVSGLFNLFSLKFITDLFNGSIETPSVWKDSLFIVSLILVITIALLAGIIPLVGSFNLVPTSDKYVTVEDNAYIQGLGSSDTGGPEGPTLDCLGADKDKPECDMTPCDPTKQDCRWPANGFVYQGPQSTEKGGSCPGTHEGAQAIDIDPLNGEVNIPVHSTINGKVVAAYYRDTTGQRGGTGNHVIVEGDSYSLWFYHLASVKFVNVGDKVTIGQIIGIMDDTGHSTGTHLHYEYRGSGSINQILPISVPTCNNYNGNLCPCPNIITGVTP